jgi:hypothetical protein
VPAKKKTKTAKTDRQRPPRQNALPEAVAGSRPVTLIAFAVGDRVSHPQFGTGTIEVIKGSTLSIAFDTHGTKQIIESFVRLLKKITSDYRLEERFSSRQSRASDAKTKEPSHGDGSIMLDPETWAFYP